MNIITQEAKKRQAVVKLADCPKTKKILVKRQRMWYN